MGVAAWLVLTALAGDARHEQGREIYDLRCYVCHGYAGDARTMAATTLHPPPRDFTAADPEQLDRARMIDAVRHGRPGTGMTSMARVLTDAEIERVVDYVRAEFMTGVPSRARYHTAANGWPDHERYAPAFPFARRELAIDAPWTELTADQRAGRDLFVKTCVVCHDGARAVQAGPHWQARSVSWPRNLYDHRAPDAVDAVSGATVHTRHERAPDTTAMDEVERRGARLFTDNCAFCHAADGSGQGWIGAFLDPPPRDLSEAWLATRTPEQLEATIGTGLPGTSMPAWRGLLSDDEIEAVVRYLYVAARLR